MTRHTVSIHDFHLDRAERVLASDSVMVYVDRHYLSKRKILSFSVYVARPNEYIYKLSFGSTITIFDKLEKAVLAYNEI